MEISPLWRQQKFDRLNVNKVQSKTRLEHSHWVGAGQSVQEDKAVTVKTAVGRLVKGTLIEEGPYYTHSYGKFVPEIIDIDKQLREIMFGGEK